MLRKRVAVLVAAAMMVLSMLAVSAPAFAQGEGGCDPQPGQTEKAQSSGSTPPQGKPGETNDLKAGASTTRATLERGSVYA